MILGGLGRLAREQRSFSGPWGYLDGRIPPPELADGYGYPGGAAGILVNDTMAMRVSAVHACVSLIAETVSTLPVGAFRNQGTTKTIIEDNQLLNDPHPEMDQNDWCARLLVSGLMRGNSYGLITAMGRTAYPTEILPMHADAVAVRRNSDGEIEYNIPGHGVELAYPRGRMWHVRGLSMPGALVGFSPISYAAQSIGLALATEEFGARFFGDGAHPSGFITTPDKFHDTPADRARAKRIVESFRQQYGDRRRLPAMLTGGAEWKPLSINPNEAQFLETRRFQLNEIARLYRVPPHMISDVERSTSWGTGMEEQGISFVTYTLNPWLIRFEHALSKLLPGGQYVKFNVAGLMRGDLAARYMSYAVGRQWGWLCANEIRALEDLPPIEGGEVYLHPSNMLDAKSGAPPAQRGGDTRSQLERYVKETMDHAYDQAA